MGSSLARMFTNTKERPSLSSAPNYTTLDPLLGVLIPELTGLRSLPSQRGAGRTGEMIGRRLQHTVQPTPLESLRRAGASALSHSKSSKQPGGFASGPSVL